MTEDKGDPLFVPITAKWLASGTDDDGRTTHSRGRYSVSVPTWSPYRTDIEKLVASQLFNLNYLASNNLLHANLGSARVTLQSPFLSVFFLIFMALWIGHSYPACP